MNFELDCVKDKLINSAKKQTNIATCVWFVITRGCYHTHSSSERKKQQLKKTCASYLICIFKLDPMSNSNHQHFNLLRQNSVSK